MAPLGAWVAVMARRSRQAPETKSVPEAQVSLTVVGPTTDRQALQLLSSFDSLIVPVLPDEFLSAHTRK